MSFDEVLKLHIDSIQKRDLNAFVSTVDLDEITLIMNNGLLIVGGDQFIAFHKEWFTDDEWKIEYSVIKKVEYKEIAYALLSIDYTDYNSEGKLYSVKYFLNLIFKKYNGSWFLIFDQNTPNQTVWFFHTLKNE